MGNSHVRCACGQSCGSILAYDWPAKWLMYWDTLSTALFDDERFKINLPKTKYQECNS